MSTEFTATEDAGTNSNADAGTYPSEQPVENASAIAIENAAPIEMHDLESRDLPHYHGFTPIGSGAQASVLRALDEQGRAVAIKVFDLRTAEDWKCAELFEREVSVLQSLHIEGIPTFIETVKTDHRIYLVESYIDAPSLETLLRNDHVFTPDEIADIVRGICPILAALARCTPPIVHRDIKPANILVDAAHRVHLVDFGVVQIKNATVSLTFAGTAGYVAPEQLYGKSSPASDIFSLGATLLHLTTHIAPYDMQLDGILPDFDRYIPAQTPAWLQELIRRMMAVKPADRPQSADEILHILNASPSSTPIESKLERTLPLPGQIQHAAPNTVATTTTTTTDDVALVTNAYQAQTKARRWLRALNCGPNDSFRRKEKHLWYCLLFFMLHAAFVGILLPIEWVASLGGILNDCAVLSVTAGIGVTLYAIVCAFTFPSFPKSVSPRDPQSTRATCAQIAETTRAFYRLALLHPGQVDIALDAETRRDLEDLQSRMATAQPLSPDEKQRLERRIRSATLPPCLSAPPRAKPISLIRVCILAYLSPLPYLLGYYAYNELWVVVTFAVTIVYCLRIRKWNAMLAMHGDLLDAQKDYDDYERDFLSECRGK